MAETAWISAQNHALATDWASRVVTNGGAAPSDYTVARISDFCGALDAAGLTATIAILNVFAPDNLIAAITPLIKNYGSDPWTNTNFTSADLTVNGLKGNGTNRYLNTGFIPSAAFVATDCGISLYNTFADIGTGTDFGANMGTAYLHLNVCAAYVVQFGTGTAGNVLNANETLPYGLGFTSGNRTAANTVVVYSASSTVAFGTVGTSAAAGVLETTYALFSHAMNNGGTPAYYSNKRLSFAAAHHGLTSGQSQSLYNAVQTLRRALGGGWL